MVFTCYISKRCKYIKKTINRQIFSDKNHQTLKNHGSPAMRTILIIMILPVAQLQTTEFFKGHAASIFLSEICLSAVPLYGS